MNWYIKLAVIVFMGLFSQFSFGQKYSVYKKNMSYFGLTGGFNFSLPLVTERYSLLSMVDISNNEDFKKEYDKLGENTGAQFSAFYSYSFTNSISMIGGFGYRSLGFKYFTHYSWIDTLENNNFDREMHHLQKISYFSIPLLVRWDMSKSQLMPYVQGGFFLEFRHQAKKEIYYDNTIDDEETDGQVSNSGMASLTDHTRKFNMGIMGGVGINYYTKHVTFGIESNFRFGFFKIINDKKRYSDLTGFALQYLDVLDQLRLSTLSVQFTVSIPINHSVSLNILRRKHY